MGSIVKVKNGTEKINIQVCQEQNLMELLQENNISIANHCRGNGTCGKCKVKVVSGYLPITEADKRKLTEYELKQGIRLACKAVVGKETEEKKGKEIDEDKIYVNKTYENKTYVEEKETLIIEIIGEQEEDIVIEAISREKVVTEFEEKSRLENKEIKMKMKQTEDRQTEEEQTKYFLAVDIGTTTIAMALINEETGKVCDVYTSLNHQRKYGADVISRIVAANDGKAEELKKLVEEDLRKGINALIEAEYEIKSGLDSNRNDKNVTDKMICLNRIIIAGNVTMIHLLMGYSCETLGKYPFRSEHLEQIECKLKDCISFDAENGMWNDCMISNKNKIYQKYKNTSVTIFPGISAFVGGDIVAGVVACGGFEKEELSLLLDLGTNGEMVLGNKNRILTASAAAGPAFEGGNIVCGTASIPGAICQVKIQNQRAVVKTIKNKIPPVGICGTGLVSVIAQLKDHQLVNEDGVLKPPYDEKGFPLWVFENGEKIALYQKDIREFQMAKAAIRAGIEMLMEEYGCVAGKIKNVYIAGGFGTAINIEDILTIKMVPEEFRSKISIIGNSALQGAICYGKDITARKQIENICHKSENIMLSQNLKFQKKYMEYMKL